MLKLMAKSELVSLIVNAPTQIQENISDSSLTQGGENIIKHIEKYYQLS